MRGSALRKLYRDTSGANVRLRCYPVFMLDQRSGMDCYIVFKSTSFNGIGWNRCDLFTSRLSTFFTVRMTIETAAQATPR